MGRPRDDSLIEDFTELERHLGRTVSIKLRRHDGRRNARHRFIIRGVDVGPRGTVRVEDFHGGQHDVRPGNFVNFRLLERGLVPGDFVVDGEQPGRRGIVIELAGSHARCKFVDGEDLLPAHQLVLAEEAPDDLIHSPAERVRRSLPL